MAEVGVSAHGHQEAGDGKAALLVVAGQPLPVALCQLRGPRPRLDSHNVHFTLAGGYKYVNR